MKEANCSNIGWLFSLIGWILIVIGWLYNNTQSNKRESRKELRASLDNILDEVHDIQEKALLYYVTAYKDSHELAFKIKAAQDRLITKTERLSSLHKGYFESSRLVKFIDVVTGGDFEEKKRKVRSYSDKSDNLLIEISHSADKLISNFESDYCEVVEKTPKKKNLPRMY